jgi:hypothetical protein
MKSKIKSPQGQALVEFALMITVLLMLIFLIIEGSRIFWGWMTVQHAAREGARYAITGQFIGPDCAVEDLPKFDHICDEITRERLRAAAIVSVTHTALSGLPLNEQSTTYQDVNFYNIEVQGVAPGGDRFIPDYGGGPGEVVFVRATYRVAIITPFFNNIIPSVRVVGLVTENNEQFGQMSGSQARGLPNDPPAVPTEGPTPTPTETPEVPPTITPTPTATIETPPPPTCGPHFTGNHPIAGDTLVVATGDVGDELRLYDANNNELGLATVGAPSPGHLCQGAASFTGLAPLQAGQFLIVINHATGENDSIVVLAGTPTATPTATFTPPPPPTFTATPSITPTPTPSGPFIGLLPNCAPGPNIEFTIFGGNWPTNRSISIYWNTSELVLTIPQNQHNGSFSRQITRNNVTAGTYQVRAVASGPNGEYASAIFTLPCPGSTPVPTSMATPTGTPVPADLIVVGPPELISTPPIVAYQPVQYRVVISNTGDIDVNQQFFIDLYLDPTDIFTTHIPVGQSSGYQGVSGLPGQTSRVLSITAPFGFHNEPENHAIYGMVDSLQQVPETNEENNVSTPAFTDEVTPAATPTPTATPDDGANLISGVIRSRIGGNWVPQFRAQVVLIDDNTGQAVRTTQTNSSGFYEFLDIPDSLYSVAACISIDNTEYTGIRTGLEIPESNEFVDIFMFEGPCS